MLEPTELQVRITELETELRQLRGQLIDSTRPDCVSGLRTYLKRNPLVLVKEYPWNPAQCGLHKYSHNHHYSGAFIFYHAVELTELTLGYAANEFNFDERGAAVLDGRGQLICRFDYS